VLHNRLILNYILQPVLSLPVVTVSLTIATYALCKIGSFHGGDYEE
jgi:type IV secretory pathway VirB6-like protein